MREYAALSHAPLSHGARLAHPPMPRVTLDDPALSVMTDLSLQPAATTFPDEPADRAHALMVERGVRLLFVLDRDGAIAGVITATDLLGDKRMRVMQSRGVPHGELRVTDLMTGASMVEAIPYAEVAQMRVGHVVATLRSVRRQHLLVSEHEGAVVRGILSASRVARQLGLHLETVEIARTFADIEAALVR
jgi:CBS-domain-containing membrane protein